MMHIDGKEYIRRYTALLREEGLESAAVFRAVLAEFEGTPYLKGTDSVEQSDCSGSVCTAMSAALGRAVRVRARDLYDGWFTRDEEAPGAEDGRIYAAFFLDGEGIAVHVTGWCGDCFMNVSEKEKAGGARRSIAELRRLYPHLSLRIRSMAV